MAIVMPSLTGWNYPFSINRDIPTAYAVKSTPGTAIELNPVTLQRPPFSLVSSPPPLWAINSAVAKTPTKGETSPEASAATQQKTLLQAKRSGKLSPLTLPNSPSSPEPSLSASPFSSASTPVKYLSVVSGKHRAGLPEELDPYYTIECFDQFTKKLVPLHVSMIGDSELGVNSISNDMPTSVTASPTAATPMLTSSPYMLPAKSMMSSMIAGIKPAVPEKSPTKLSIQQITLTHKYQEAKQSRQGRRFNEPSLSGSRSGSEGSNGDLSSTTLQTNKIAPTNVEAVTPVVKSPLPINPMLSAANFAAAAAAAASLPAIPQPFSLPIMFPAFTPTTPGNQLPFVYPTPLGIGSPLSALQHFPMLSQASANQYMMVDCPTFVWPPSSKVAGGAGFNFMMPGSSILQTPPSSAVQEMTNRKRCSPPPAVANERHAKCTETISPKRPRTEYVSTSCPCPPISSNNTTLIPATTAAVMTTSRVDENCSKVHAGEHSNGSSSESEAKDNGDSDSEDDMVTCLQEPAPIEGTDNLPPFPNGRGVVQLWQFLLDMLLTPDKNYMIQWTGNEYEFTILQPDDIAALWGERKGKPRMNYDKLSRGLRYYYSKGIMDKVPGKKLTFKFTCNVEDYVRTRSSNPNAVQTLRAIIRNSKQGHDMFSDFSTSTAVINNHKND